MRSQSFKFVVLATCLLISTHAYSYEQKKCPLSEVFYGKEESVKVFRPTDQEFGELSVVVNSVTRTPHGEKVGIAVLRRTNLELNSLTPGPHAMYETSTTVILPEGTFTTLSVSDYDKELVTKTIERPIIGGTGKYAGARGVVQLDPISSSLKGHHKATLKAEVFCD